MKMMVVFNRKEIQERIPYAMICETRYGSKWETTKRKRRWAQEFTQSERDMASKLFSLSHVWYLTKGVPDEQIMSFKTLELWERIAAFCASL